MLINWISDHYIEAFGALTGIIYVFLEIRQNILLWPVGIMTSAVYIWVFFTSKFYADMSLQVYYLVISTIGWYWWQRGTGRRVQSKGQRQATNIRPERGDISHIKFPPEGSKESQIKSPLEGGKGGVPSMNSSKNLLFVTRITRKAGIILAITFAILYIVMWTILDNLTDSPVPGWDAFITSLSIIATWMLARKLFEHWYLWIIVNFTSVIIFYIKGLHPTVVLYIVYGVMSFAGLKEWKKTIKRNIL